jgi:hypothetical protein
VSPAIVEINEDTPNQRIRSATIIINANSVDLIASLLFVNGLAFALPLEENIPSTAPK